MAESVDILKKTSGTDDLTQRLTHILALHFAPEDGSRYWLEKQRELGIDIREAVSTVDDLAILGVMDESALSRRPIEDFIPLALKKQRKEFIFAETGGTLGLPKYAVHREDEFHLAFVEPFVKAARRVTFPQGCNWLYIGPTGPHVIGKAARLCARALGSPDPFSVDFDPRWAKKMVEGSFAAGRYLKHIESQALRILDTQHIGVLFSTPPVLQSLGRKIPQAKRDQISGIHFGGMSVDCQLRANLADLFPNAVMLSGYGNTLFGMAPELNYHSDTGIDYYPQGNRLVYRLIEQNEQMEDAQRLVSQVDYEQRGQVMVHRLDETQFIANMIERDSAIRIKPSSDDYADGFILDGLRDPQPIVNKVTKPVMGLY